MRYDVYLFFIEHAISKLNKTINVHPTLMFVWTFLSRCLMFQISSQNSSDYTSICMYRIGFDTILLYGLIMMYHFLQLLFCVLIYFKLLLR